MARLDRLVSAKGIAQLAAVIGRRFAYDLLQAVSQLDDTTLQRELGTVRRGRDSLSTRFATPGYLFFQTCAHPGCCLSVTVKSMRQQYHQRIAQVLADAVS